MLGLRHQVLPELPSAFPLRAVPGDFVLYRLRRSFVTSPFDFQRALF
jgi:hypothetical protein